MIQWMLYSLAISALLGLAALAAEYGLKKRGLPLRWIWLLAIVCSIGLSAVPWLRLNVVRDEPAVIEMVTPTSIERSAGAGEAAPASPRSALEQLSPRLDRPLLRLWAIFSLGGALFLYAVQRNLARRRRGWRVEKVEGMPVLISRDVGPAVVGFRDPAIVLPAWVLELEQAQRELVVAHEAEHLWEGDSRLLTAALLSLVLMPWNAPLWWQVRRLRKATELDCDARVVESWRDTRSYGELLVEMGERSSLRSFAYAGFANASPFLETRIENLVASKPRLPRALASSAIALALLLAALGFQAPSLALAVPSRAEREVPERILNFSELELEEVVEVAMPEAGVPVIARPLPATGPAYSLAELDRPPALRNGAQMMGIMERLYPRILQDAAIGGSVLMEFVIEADGVVDMATVKVLDSPHEQLSDASIKAVERFRFEPGRYRGQPVRTLIQMPITWRPFD